MDLINVIALSALMILTTATVVWYFRIRKKMLQFLKEFTVRLEEVLKPKDKEYRLLGYLVGYKAFFTLSDGSKAYVLLTTAPKFSLIYYPIAKALKHEDRVAIALEPSKRKVVKEVHAVKVGEARLKAILSKDLREGLSKLNMTKVNVRWGSYEIFYEDPKDVDLLIDVLNNEILPIYKISAYKDLNLTEVVSKAEVDKIEYLYERLREYTKRVTKAIQ